LLDSDGVSKVGKLLFKGISDLSLSRGQLPSSVKIFIFYSFEFLLQFKNNAIALLHPPHQLPVLQSIGLEKLLHLLIQIASGIFGDGKFQSLEFFLRLINLAFVHVDYPVGLD
jgi:hypothetical protein